MNCPQRKVRALILTGFGINCHEETAAAFRLAGASARIAHLNDVFYGICNMHDFDIIGFPGGFSFGDDLGSGQVLADKLRFKPLPNGVFFLDEAKAAIANGKFIFGICNGFQALVNGGVPEEGLRITIYSTLNINLQETLL